MTWQDASSIGPILWVAIGAVCLLLTDAFVRRSDHSTSHLTALAMVFLALAGAVAFEGMTQPGRSVFAGALAADAFARFFDLAFIVAAAVTIAVGAPYFARGGRPIPEFHPLVLFATVGMMVLAAATDLITLFLGLETMSIALYVLAALQRRSSHSNEAGFKYLILGAFSSAFLLYGIALLYGATGTTSLSAIALLSPSSRLALTGYGLLLVGLGFKVAAVPFHMWTPDVYDGSPAPVAGFMAAGVKAASFAALLRVSFSGISAFESVWFELLIVLSVVTMTAGNLIALAQSNLKRMLAYSAIAHAGYLLIGVVVARPVTGDAASSGILFYLFVYALMNLGAFALVSLVSRSDGENVQLSGYAGLARRHPVAAAAMAIFMLSLAGIPPTAGFWGKLYIFQAAIAADHATLAVIALLNSAVAIYYYLRVIVLMYMREPEPEQDAYRAQSIQTHAVMLVLALLILWVGLLPGALSEWARLGAGALAGG